MKNQKFEIKHLMDGQAVGMACLRKTDGIHWYVRLGWTHIGDDELLGHRVTVMSISI